VNDTTPPRQIHLTEKGKWVIPRAIELRDQGMDARTAFDQAEAEWAARTGALQ
jgi:hypothetical protein